MNQPEIEVFPDRSRLFAAAAARIAETLQQALRVSPLATFALAGGSTPKSVYSLLADSPFSTSVAWDRVHFFWGDERLVPPDHPESNFGMAAAAMLSRLPLSQANIHRVPCELESAEAAARRYEDEIREHVPGSPDPHLDLVLLGLGVDCHTASLFPGIRSDPGRLVMAAFVPRLASHRISMTFRMLNAARRVIFVVAGSEKSASVREALSGAEDCPAAGIRPTDGRVLWLLDAEAASALGPRPASGASHSRSL